jgi:hypothetical protein
MPDKAKGRKSGKAVTMKSSAKPKSPQMAKAVRSARAAQTQEPSS